MKKHKTTRDDADTASSVRLPWVGLIPLTLAGFISLLTEIIPAGLLPQISEGLGISEALAGQFITLYALGSVLAAIPLTTATRGWRRRPLLLLSLICFFLFNSVTALSSSYTITLVARFLAGAAGGVLWGMLAGYASRMVPDSLKGRAMAVAGIGTPLAMALGVPAGTLLGTLVGWRTVFGIMSLFTVLLIVWVLLKVPDFAGQSAHKRLPLHKVFVIPGVRPILFVVLIWVLAHNILYTYITPYLAQVGLGQRVDTVLFVFGIASAVGLWITGIWIDRMLRPFVLISLAGFALASMLFGISSNQPVGIFLAAALWGLTFGGAASLLQTAVAEAAGDNVDVAQSMLVTAWNLAVSAGGLIGAALLVTVDVLSFPWVMLILVLIALLVVWRAREHGFTSKSG
ncbi:MFS transporter [Paenibacillus sp. N3/727]|uniref:MFS transporter n=1 Tax=Paenibacillus sp. N3/727 TaxID=2925845 RepID=UPI001F53A550|nr:MFS transporter [Paenibacillus sp. N3/727]UNK18700.1 MFS transporter [Paenibacillus sp. N3/727]